MFEDAMPVTPINWNIVLPTNPGKALTFVGACVVVLAGAGWALFSFGYTRGKDIGQDEVAAYKAATGANLPDITSGLTNITNELRDGLKIFERNKTLEIENSSYQKQLSETAKARADADVAIKELQGKLTASLEMQTTLRDQILRLSGNSRHLSIKERSTELLGEGHVIGIINVSASEVRTNLDNKPQVFSVGINVPLQFSDKTCTLTLLNITDTYTTANFDWSCRPKEAGQGNDPDHPSSVRVP
jgi:hypothetical protein